MYENELYHYGVKGMKWGVRRYRNEDGSLTPAGKKREQKRTFKEVKKYGRYTSDHKKALRSKSADLQKAIDEAAPYIEKLVKSQNKTGMLWTERDNKYDDLHYKYYSDYKKKHADPNSDEIAERYADNRAKQEIDKLYGKRIDEQTSKNKKYSEEYRQYVKTVTADILGEYGDVKVRKGSNRNSAADALDDIIYWDNAVEKGVGKDDDWKYWK